MAAAPRRAAAAASLLLLLTLAAALVAQPAFAADKSWSFQVGSKGQAIAMANSMDMSEYCYCCCCCRRGRRRQPAGPPLRPPPLTGLRTAAATAAASLLPSLTAAAPAPAASARAPAASADDALGRPLNRQLPGCHVGFAAGKGAAQIPSDAAKQSHTSPATALRALRVAVSLAAMPPLVATAAAGLTESVRADRVGHDGIGFGNALTRDCPASSRVPGQTGLRRAVQTERRRRRRRGGPSVDLFPRGCPSSPTRGGKAGPRRQGWACRRG
eukprot:354981-Chlamydomonas_euryale.AAC.2